MKYQKKLVTFIMGTRPEVIKLAPLIIVFKKSKKIKVRVVLTGQHKEMAKDVMDLFHLKEDLNLSIMKSSQSLNYISVSILNGLKSEFLTNRPDLVLVQGDTTSAFISALAAFYEGIKIAHVEAGLRTNNLLSPFPEEANRRLISQIATINFVPTKNCLENLKKEGIHKNVFLTGNTVIDSINNLINNKMIKREDYFDENKNLKLILVTVHRRENWGKGLKNIIKGIINIVESNPNVGIVLPMHKNKKIRILLKKYLDKIDRVLLKETLSYDHFVGILSQCHFVLTDSGGIQEEAPFLGKPVLILRDTTERVESIKLGSAMLVGTEPKEIFEKVNMLLTNNDLYNSMSVRRKIYGDGKASERIFEKCLDLLNIS